ncbi:hypothetical protein GIB67_030196 [Kingdonia uniflora]|uniref:tRNA-dihydrouridine(47) synthase [NAD(P)(+)] n=1 Tax=Kingdonia uniflora TaxID=39325 RepID=A0A7J7L0N2_9MAGN|nr:hypothetical protein GIB67_030196 [Kingdonia uniflora]
MSTELDLTSNESKFTNTLSTPTEQPSPAMDEASMEVETNLSSTQTPSNPIEIQLSPEELIAKSIAPVKREYLRPPPPRPTPSSSNGGVITENNSISLTSRKRRNQRDKLRGNDNRMSHALLKMYYYKDFIWGKSLVTMISKALQDTVAEIEKKSALHICPEVAKASDASACRYGGNCRYSHDLEAYQAQKPADLEGNCPFLIYEGPCPYGLACRYSGTHRVDVNVNASIVQKKSSEVNGLNKDVQKLLWKNKMKFPKADTHLKLLGLLDKSKKKMTEVDEEEADHVTSNGSHAPWENDGGEAVCDYLNSNEGFPGVPTEEGLLNDSIVTDDPRPTKKAKNPVDENSCYGTSVLEKGLEENGSHIESETASDTFLPETDLSLKLNPREKKLIDFRGKMYLAPLTTVGNLPFRRLCKVLGADITCGEMAMCTNLLQGQASEWALLRRHSSEDIFGVQICGAYPDTVARAVELIDRECDVDFIDINMGCPIDIVVNKGAGSALLTKPMRIKNVIQAAFAIVDKPITVKVRTAYFEGRNRIDSLITDISNWGASAVTIHGRSRQQRYSKLADWDYINQCATKAPDTLHVLGNGDVYSYLDWNQHISDCPKLSACMIARGSLIKPWIFTEIKEQRHWDITSGERLNILKDFVQFGLEHWGSDTKGIGTTRHFLLEWLSYMYRYGSLRCCLARFPKASHLHQNINLMPMTKQKTDEFESLNCLRRLLDDIQVRHLLMLFEAEQFDLLPFRTLNRVSPFVIKTVDNKTLPPFSQFFLN